MRLGKPPSFLHPRNVKHPVVSSFLWHYSTAVIKLCYHTSTLKGNSLWRVHSALFMKGWFFFFSHWAHGCCVAHTLSLINNRLIFITPGLRSALQTDTAAYNGNTSPSSQIQLTLGWNAPSYLTAHSSSMKGAAQGTGVRNCSTSKRSSSPDLQRRRRAWSVTRTPRLILAAWQAPPELIDHCWEGFWIHLSCRETALQQQQQQQRHWARRAEGMEREQRAQRNASGTGLNETAAPTGCSVPLCGKGNVNEPKEDVEQAAGYIQTTKDPEYGAVRIPSTGLQTVVIRFSNLTCHPQRFKQTNNARHFIQLSSCEGNSF